MNELIKLVAKNAKIPEATAKVAVETVVKFLKDKLPEPYASQLDNLIEGKGAADLLGNLGGLLGKK